MARLSAQLIAQMATPQYAGMLGKSISDGITGVSDAYREVDQRQGAEAMAAILRNADPNDPNVANSVAAVAQQQGINPALATEMIEKRKAAIRATEDQAMQAEGLQLQKQAAVRQQEQSARQAESMEMAKKTFAMKQAEHNYTKGVREKEAAQEEVSGRAVQLAGNPDALEAYMNSVDPTQVGAARKAVAEVEKHNAMMDMYREEQQDRAPFSAETVEKLGSNPAMEDAVAAYEKMKDQYPKAAKRLLLDQYAKVQTNELTLSRQRDPTVTTSDVKAADGYIREVVAINEGFQRIGWGVDPADMPALAHKVAIKMKTEPGWSPTKEAIESIIDENKQVEAAAAAKRGEAEPTVPEVRRKKLNGKTYVNDGSGWREE